MSEEITEDQIGQLKKALLSMQLDLLDKIDDRARVETVDLDLPIGRLSRVDALQQQSMAKAEVQRAKRSLRQIESALEFIEEGTYGFCKMCEEPIGILRLKARPASPFCIACLQNTEI